MTVRAGSLEDRQQQVLTGQSREALDFASWRAMAKQHLAQSEHVDAHHAGPAGDERAVVRKDLSCAPADDGLQRFRQRLTGRCAPVRNARSVGGFELCQRRKFAVAVNELNRNIQGEQALKCFSWKRSGEDIATHDNPVDPKIAEFCEDCFERGQVAVDVVERRNSMPRGHGVETSTPRKSSARHALL